MDEDEYDTRPEATIRYTVQQVQQFSKLKNSILSPACYVRSLPWKISVMSRNSKAKNSLGFFLKCSRKNKSSSWSCNVKAEYSLLSVRPDVQPFTRKTQRLFCSGAYSWGYLDFMAWNDVLDPDKGYIKDDAITLEVRVVTDASQVFPTNNKNVTTVTRPTITWYLETQKGNQEMLPKLNVTDSTEVKEAIQRNSLEDMKLLSINRIYINTIDDKGNTPLQYAIMYGNIKIVEYLLESKANVCKPGQNGKTPLLIALETEDIDIIKLLLRHGAGDTIQSAFFQAVTLQNLEIIDLLIEHGALLDINYKNGHTALTRSVEIENLDIL